MKSLIGITLFSVIYSVVRYVAFAPKNVEHIPAFIMNKSISMAAAIALVVAVWNRYKGRNKSAALYFRYTMFMAIIHIALSLVVLRPGYFPEFFLNGSDRLKFMGEMVFLSGAVSLGLIWLFTGKISDTARKWLGGGLVCTLISHVGFMGICRGLNIDAKHAYLPPMWFLSLLTLGVGVIYAFKNIFFRKGE